MTDAKLLRRRVRMILSALPRDRRASEKLMFDKLQPDFPELTTDELATAIGWNQSLGLIDYRWDQDEERNLWALTAAGWKKEGMG